MKKEDIILEHSLSHYLCDNFEATLIEQYNILQDYCNGKIEYEEATEKIVIWEPLEGMSYDELLYHIDCHIESVERLIKFLEGKDNV